MNDKPESAARSKIEESDFILRLVDIFRENEIECKITGENELTATDCGCEFVIKVTSGQQV